MTKAEQLRRGRSDAIRKLSRRRAAAEHVTPPPQPAGREGLNNEATDAARPVEADPVDSQELCEDLPENGNDDDHTAQAPHASQ